MTMPPRRAGQLRLARPHARPKKKPVPQRLRKRARIIGVVLAGGRSARMGHDKALVRFPGNEDTLLARTVTLLQEVCGWAIVVGREQPGFACVPDMAPDCGPVGGIATALEHCFGAACLVLSCDLPFMDKAALETLIAHRNKRPQGKHLTAYTHRDTGHIEPLVAIYEPECLPFFRICVNEKLLKINRVVPLHQQHYLPYAPEDARPFFNLNYPEDIAAAQAMLRPASQG